MESLPLKQTIARVVDTMGMKGPVERRAAAEEVLRQAPNDFWSLRDRHDADLKYIYDGVTEYMREPMGEQGLIKSLPNIPPAYRTVFEKLPRYICVSQRGGAGSQHVMSWRATKEDWEKNFALKAYVTERAELATQEARQIRDLLAETGAGSLAELFNGARSGDAA